MIKSIASHVASLWNRGYGQLGNGLSFRGDRSYNSVTLAHQLSFAKGPLIQVSRPSFLSLRMFQIAGTLPTKCYRVQSFWALSLGGAFVIATCPTNKCPGTWGITYDHKGRIYMKYCEHMFFPCLQTQGNSLRRRYLAQDMLSSHKPIVPHTRPRLFKRWIALSTG